MLPTGRARRTSHRRLYVFTQRRLLGQQRQVEHNLVDARHSRGCHHSVYRFILDRQGPCNQRTESGIITESFEISGGTADDYIRFESKNLKKFFIRSITVAQGEPLENILLEDSFDKATSGTFDSPIERISADDYTEMPGWSVNSAIVAKGMFGTFDGMILGGRPYGGGTMVTPAPRLCRRRCHNIFPPAEQQAIRGPDYGIHRRLRRSPRQSI